MIRIILLSIFLISAVAALGQERKLATEYFRSGEYEKASVIFKKLMAGRGGADYYFNRYIECLLKLDRYDEAEDAVKKEIKKRPNDIHLHVTFGNLYEQQGLFNKAQSEYNKGISKLSDNPQVVTRLAGAFQSIRKYDKAVETYLRGGKLIGSDLQFAYQIADLYRREGDMSRMIEYYLKSLRLRPEYAQNVKTFFSRYLSDEDFVDLQQQLYIQIQDFPESIVYPELLEWVYIQKGDYKNALRQVKALDRKHQEQGLRVFNLATVATNAKDYEAALSAYTYITDDLGKLSPYYLDAKKESLSVRRRLITSKSKFDEADLVSLRVAYESFLEEFGKNRESATLIAEWAQLEARYLNNINKAVTLLEELIDIPNVDRFIKANAKIDLGDYYLIQGEIWESTLLYSQVDKEFREDYLGEMARYKNARLSYFNGDFEWAQAQYDILKAATSRLISNDAIDQSVFIMDNLGLDTTARPLQIYARAELLNFQNKHEEAFKNLDSINLLFPGHQLEDDIWYLKARSYKRQRQYDKAIAMYERVVETYPEDIRADNSIFEMAELYENILDDKDKAMSLYEKLYIEYSGSTFAVIARKRYRSLRGDEI